MGVGIQLLSHQIGISNIDREAEKLTLLPGPALLLFRCLRYYDSYRFRVLGRIFHEEN